MISTTTTALVLKYIHAVQARMRAHVVDLHLRHGLAVLELLARGDVWGALDHDAHVGQAHAFAIHPAVWRQQRRCVLELMQAARLRRDELAVAEGFSYEWVLVDQMVEALERCVMQNEPSALELAAGAEGRAA